MLSVKEAAGVAGASRSLVYGWVKAKAFPVYRRGAPGKRGKIVIPEADFRAFLETQKVGAEDSSAPLGLAHLSLR